MKQKKPLNTKQAGMILGICPRRVRVLITEGRLKAKKFGRDYMICYHDLDPVRIRKPGNPGKKKGPA